MSTNSSCWSRYLDILLGLVLLLSLVCLLYAGYSQSRIWIIAFITASLAVVLTYWCWFLYIKASGMDFPDSEEITWDVLAVLAWVCFCRPSGSVSSCTYSARLPTQS